MKIFKECGDCKKKQKLIGLTDDEYIDPDDVLFSDDEEDSVKGLSDEDYIDPETALDDIEESCGKKSKKKKKWLPFKEYVKQKEKVNEALKVIEEAGFTAEILH